MVSPFDIEEIFPDIAAESVRLPRRQTGGSPQGLAVTLITDYTLRTRAWLPTAAIVALLGDFDVTTGAARTTISRLARRGVLEGSRQGRHSSYRLTLAAAASLSLGGMTVAAYAAHPDIWDGSWTLVIFTLPKEESIRRSTLRTHLRWLGFAPLYDGVWVSPNPLTIKERAELPAVTPGTITAFRAQHLELTAGGTRNPIDAWDIAGIAEQYDRFIQRWEPLLPDLRTGSVTGAAAVRARAEVMDTYRRFPALDPLLPSELMPPDWPRARARELFRTVYDHLAEPAQDHVRAVVAQTVEGPHLDIRAHTVAEMSLGIRPLHPDDGPGEDSAPTGTASSGAVR
ncbi:PaaX family transcriptional regulator C-terminal domain-containing protein [Micromonospora sp. KC213]|uniref:PaaX family transcriptional regulator n=1 Tax=Micromonospora sp. KC213 TaxID=2530378 RepID=UPI0010528C04|nr:PaaX family transcriptional regulator C-terminal domain-containing protein [Micromonospora sp. KC213]TDC42447.1 PaaX family transcriptional regulator [Micromonospora sp. KC213]